MPHLKVRGLEKRKLIEKSKEIIDGLTEIIKCDRTWFTIEHVDTEYIFDGKTQHGSSDSSRGIGIGLSICKSIILAHDGKIFAKNNLNGGASFTFVLPMKGESDYAE